MKTDKMQEVIAKVQRSDFLQSMMQGMMSTLPATIIGSFATLLNSINIPAYQAFLQKTGISNLLNIAVLCTTNIIALIIAMGVAGAYAKKKGVKESNQVSFVGLVAFLILTPFNTTYDDWGQAVSMIPTQWLGSSGMFSAIIVGTVVGGLYAFIVKKNWTIKMPDSVPPVISNSFSAMIPGLIIGALFLVIRLLFGLTSYGNLHAFIYGVLQIPLSGLTANVFSLCIIMIITGILWFFGIHGAMVTLGIIAPVLMTLDFENMAAVAAGAAAPNTLGFAFYSISTMAGGYIGLQICMTLFCKSQRYKTLSKVSLIPAIFTISEPLIFGAPLVLNPDFAIPSIFGQVATFIVAFLLSKIGFLPNLPGVNPPTGTPFIVRGFIAGGWRYALFELAMMVLLTFIWLPFVRKADQKALEAEASEQAED